MAEHAVSGAVKTAGSLISGGQQAVQGLAKGVGQVGAEVPKLLKGVTGTVEGLVGDVGKVGGAAATAATGLGAGISGLARAAPGIVTNLGHDVDGFAGAIGKDLPMILMAGGALLIFMSLRESKK